MNNLNPDIKKMLIGSREMVEITIYPLSVSEEGELIRTVTGAIIQFSKEQNEEMDDDKSVIVITKIIEENLEKIFKIVTDSEAPYSIMTNNQLVEFGEILFEVNFEGLLKNGRSLFKKVQGILLLKGQSPQSVKNTDINSTTSSINDLEMADSQEVKS